MKAPRWPEESWRPILQRWQDRGLWLLVRQAFRNTSGAANRPANALSSVVLRPSLTSARIAAPAVGAHNPAPAISQHTPGDARQHHHDIRHRTHSHPSVENNRSLASWTNNIKTVRHLLWPTLP